MSADGVLKAISSLYQTSSSEEDEQEENVPALTLKRKCNTRNEGGGEEEKQKKLCSNENTCRLPLPSVIVNMFAELSNQSALKLSEEYENPSKHQGRIRTFPHERGNWTTRVYIQCNYDKTHDDLFRQLLSALPNFVQSDEFHISLSKTVILRHHWIQPFVDGLKTKLSTFSRFLLTYDTLQFYTNEEKTRTFLGLKVNNSYQQLCQIMHTVDECLSEFNLPTFYKDPSFHTSIAWCLGNECENLSHKLPGLQKILDDWYITDEQHRVIRVNEIQCQSGNKCFKFSLL